MSIEIHEVLNAPDPEGAAEALRDRLEELPVAASPGSLLEAGTPEETELPGTGPLWELFGLIRQQVAGTAAQVVQAFQASAAEDVEFQQRAAKAELNFRISGRGAAASVDLEILFPEATRIRRRRRWVVARLEEATYKLWILGAEPPPYRPIYETMTLRDEGKSLPPAERFRLLASTKGFTQMASLLPERAVAFFESVLQDPTCEPSFQLSCVMAMEFLPHEAALERLTLLSDSGDAEIRRTAVSVLWSLDRQQALGPLCALAADESWDAVDFFLQLEGASEALPLIARAGDLEVFLQCLGRLKHANCSDLALPGLAAALESEVEDLREAAFAELSALGDWRTLPAIRQRFDQVEGETRARLLESLCRLPNGETADVLCASLADGDPTVRLAAATGLCETLLTEPSCLEPLLDRALHDDHEDVRAASWVALRRHLNAFLLPVLSGAAETPLLHELAQQEWLPHVLAPAPESLAVCSPLEPALPSPREVLAWLQEQDFGDSLPAEVCQLLRCYGTFLQALLTEWVDSEDAAEQLLAVRVIHELRLGSFLPKLETLAGFRGKVPRQTKQLLRAVIEVLREESTELSPVVVPQQRLWWTELLDEVVSGCREKLEALEVFSGELFDGDGLPRPWQLLFGGEKVIRGDRHFGKRFRASARGTLDDIVSLLREELTRQWYRAVAAWPEQPGRPRPAEQPTPGRYSLFVLEVPNGHEMTRAVLIARVGPDDYLFWAVEEARGKALYSDARGRD